jgi:hypothetical protein
MLTLALLLVAALLGDPASAKDKTAGTDADRQDASQSEIRLGMSADFSASARALSIDSIVAPWPICFHSTTRAASTADGS